MNPKPIGIIGGAGPMAGTALLKKIFESANKNYGCYKDKDYPEVLFLSFPFSEMLAKEINHLQIQLELDLCLKKLRKNGAQIIGIACNTLHAFFSPDANLEGVVQMPRVVQEALTFNQRPLVFCTSTSVKTGIHKNFFSCEYPDTNTQEKIDEIIDWILRGENNEKILKEIQLLLQKQKAESILLGCTELSLFRKEFGSSKEQTIIDPLEILSEEILKQSFLRRT